MISVLLLGCSLLPAQTAVQPAGAGTSASPYQITTWQNLYWLSQNPGSWGAYCEQTADIDLPTTGDADDIHAWDSNQGWTPIGNTTNKFHGFYNGHGHKVANLYINRPNTDNVGLFGHVGHVTSTTEATIIEQLGVMEVEVTGARGSGSLAGRVTGNGNTLIDKCYASNGSVVGDGATGGLVGSNNSYLTSPANNQKPIISKSFADIAVSWSRKNPSGADKFGGLAGCNQKGITSNSYAIGSVTVNNNPQVGTIVPQRIGGLAGCTILKGLIENSYSAAVVTTSGPVDLTRVGGLVGYVIVGGAGGSNDGFVNSSFWDTEVSTQPTSGGGTGKTTAEMKTESTFTNAGWNFTSIWQINPGINNGYPYLNWQTFPDEDILPVIWVKCLTTIDADNSVNLEWTNPVNALRNHIWYYSYASLPGATGYPEYGPASDYTIPAAPLPTAVSPNQDGWTRTGVIDAATSYTHSGMDRGYYYYVIFAETATGSFSPPPEPAGGLPYYRESISYWPGDVAGTSNGSVVNFSDIALLSSAWGTQEGGPGWNNIIDVGPTQGNLRRGRPQPDNVINLDDLMIFSLNYENTDYDVFPRHSAPQTEPVFLELSTEQQGNRLLVHLLLTAGDNSVQGLHLVLQHSSDLLPEEILPGDIWPEPGFFVQVTRDNHVEITGSALGGGACLAASGTVASLSFLITGSDLDLLLEEMTARDTGNRELAIICDPDLTGIDPEITIPAQDILLGNYPNPFNPLTTISFGLQQDSPVELVIFNTRGQQVQVLLQNNLPAGYHHLTWQARDDLGQPLPAGIYLYRLQTRSGHQYGKALLLK